MVEFSGGNGGGGGLASFPVVFSDGETETDIGDVTVSPSLDFKRFQSILSQKIGISPQQFSVHLSSPSSRRKIHISGKVNLAAIPRDSGCFFVVLLKRSRRERRRRIGQLNPSHHHHHPVTILKRDESLYDRVGYGNRVSDLIMERERYLMSMGFVGFGLGEPNLDFGPVSRGADAASVCEDCLRAEESGRQAGFHGCVYDAVTFGFRSMAGPIARPYKGSD